MHSAIFNSHSRNRFWGKYLSLPLTFKARLWLFTTFRSWLSHKYCEQMLLKRNVKRTHYTMQSMSICDLQKMEPLPVSLDWKENIERMQTPCPKGRDMKTYALDKVVKESKSDLKVKQKFWKWKMFSILHWNVIWWSPLSTF